MTSAQDFPSYSAGERCADALIHAVGIVASAAGVAWMLAKAVASDGVSARTAGALAVYGLGLLGMLTASALYHRVLPGPRKALLRRVDHAMIFVMIAGTYTPFTLATAGLGATLGGAVWSGAALGVALKLRYPGRFERLGLGLYLGLGWAIVTAAGPLSATLPTRALWLLAVGGVLYTVGVVFHLMERLPYHNALWHLLVLGAAACHFVAVSAAFLP